MDWLPLHSGHPLMVHLPLVAMPLAVLLDVLAIWKQDPRWRQFATVMWVLGLVGAAAAVTTGLIAYDRVNHSDAAHKVMTLHRNVALGAVGLFLLGGAARWRWSFSRLAVFIGVLGGAGIVAAGYLGGEIVFRHAIGLPTEVLEEVMMERGGHNAMSDTAATQPAADSGVTRPVVDSTGDRTPDHSQAPPHTH
jgi:uncharacterized membrane protein